MTLLHEVAMFGRVEIAKALLGAGADRDSQTITDGATALI